jgi:hypothetical protein
VRRRWNVSGVELRRQAASTPTPPNVSRLPTVVGRQTVSPVDVAPVPLQGVGGGTLTASSCESQVSVLGGCWSPSGIYEAQMSILGTHPPAVIGTFETVRPRLEVRS